MTEDFADKLNRIEQKWQERWREDGVHSTPEEEGREKYYALEMYPYPSGKMHMGHVRNYSLGDAFARFKRMQGYNVLHPMGWDAFGLPAENAAIDRGKDPREWTEESISNMKSQLKDFGFSYDWDREIATCDPEYYKWDQWIFKKMYEQDLAYQKEEDVNWCPECETVLADGQVEDNQCWRCDSVIEQRKMKQWFYRITDYAEDLLDDLEELDEWPEKVRKMQREWIGKSEGATIKFPTNRGELEVFTTRPDTIHGATFMVLAPEHEMAEEIAEENQEVAEYVKEAKLKDAEQREEKTKAGVFTGEYAENPVNGEEIPIYVSEFVLTDYGTGAIMSVPAHDQRDYEFAKEHGIEIQPVIEPEEEHDFDESAYEGDGEHVNSGEINGLKNEDAIEKMTEILEEKGAGEHDVSYKLRDWCISRQRYWGTPIPVVYCEECGTVPLPDEELPLELPEDVEFVESGNPIETSESFRETECPECGGKAERETDTMETFQNSSWYFLRFTSPDFDELPFDEEEANYWMNVDQYIGGIEHATKHLIYARFFNKFFRDLGMVEENEPFEGLLTQGMVLSRAYRCDEHDWLLPEEVTEKEDNYYCDKCGREVFSEVMKMSKSKNNGVDPQELVDTHGADTARLFTLRATYPEKSFEWSQDGVESAKEMLKRIQRLLKENEELVTTGKPELEDAGIEDRIVGSEIQRAVEEVTRHFEEKEFNLALDRIAKLVTKLNWYREREPREEIYSDGLRKVVKMVGPVSPHLAEELWQELGEGYLIDSDWPEADEDLVDRAAERIEEYFQRVSSDIREVIEMVEEESSELHIIRAADWKYEAESAIEEELESTQEVGEIMDAVLDAELKQHASEITETVQEAVENPGKFSDRTMGEEDELKALRENRERLEDEFGLEVEIESEEESSSDKSGRAEPGRPAIVLK
ncbi:MAG: leucine--tRNA ligase [Candidatus Nanohaloarchaea archaeon]